MSTTHAVTAAVVIALIGAFATYFLLTSDNQVTDEGGNTSKELAKPAVPAFLLRSFPDTDFTQTDPAISEILSGGPSKDGIPALDNPQFVSWAEFSGSPETQAIMVEDSAEVKVYPYNILVWHEIVNDTVGEASVAVTFCPLCGSAIVYRREVAGSETTFGVSGTLIESNMVMYDRATESLWQQSTGQSLAGARYGEQLELFPMQLSTIGELRASYPDALVLSQDTGYSRDYQRNPYSGYEANDDFIFTPSEISEEFPAKEIMVVFRVADTVVTTPWQPLVGGQVLTSAVGDTQVTLQREDGELTIQTNSGETVPFYFEMWFSVSVQHGEELLVI